MPEKSLARCVDLLESFVKYDGIEVMLSAMAKVLGGGGTGIGREESQNQDNVSMDEENDSARPCVGTWFSLIVARSSGSRSSLGGSDCPHACRPSLDGSDHPVRPTVRDRRVGCDSPPHGRLYVTQYRG